MSDKDTTTYGRDVADKVRALVEEMQPPEFLKDIYGREARINAAERALADAVDELVRDVMPEW